MALAVFVALWRITVPEWHVDELVYRDAGVAYAHGDFSANRGHPWVAKELIGVSTRVFGVDEAAVRVPMALAGLATGGVLLALGAGLGGFAVGAVAAALWWLLPQAPGTIVARIDRYGLLEPPMALFATVALLAAWRWGERGRWASAVVAGVALGFAVSSKFPAALLAPAVVVPAVWAPVPLRLRAAQLGALGVAAAAAFVVPYLPDGLHGLSAVAEGVRNQTGHAQEGHVQEVAGTLYAFPPWWSHLWWQARYLTVVGAVALWAAAGSGLALARWRRSLFLAAAVVPGAAVLAVSPLKLPHYHLVLVPPLCLAAALGVVALARRRPLRPVAAVAAAVLLAVAARQLADVATIRPNGYRAARGYLERVGLADATVLLAGYEAVAREELPQGDLVTTVPPSPPAVILVDPVWADRFLDPTVAAAIGRLRPDYERVEVDRIELYLRRSAIGDQ